MFLVINSFNFGESNVIAAEWLFFPTSPVWSLTGERKNKEKKSIPGQFIYLNLYIDFVTAVNNSYQGVQASKLIIAGG